MLRGISFVLICLSLVACNKKTIDKFQNPENRADGNIANSFAVSAVAATGTSDSPPPQQMQVDKNKVSIEKSALKKEFLLQTSMVLQAMAPRFTGMRSRIVFFRQIENKLYLFEASKGLLVAANYPQTLLLAEFAITGETASSISFDFNAGMSRLFTESDWAVRDFNGSQPNTEYRSAKVAFSYIESAQILEQQTLEIQQQAQLEVLTEGGGNQNIPVAVIYYLQPYLPDPTFVASEAPANFNQMGFFEVNPQFNSESGNTSYASKLNINKPIVYAMSSNTPADYKAAVRDGILYWNKALGKEVIQVIEAPENVFAPNPKYNIVQWVDWDSAGFAYADAQMDPRTGQILHQQIYFTSAWAKIGQRDPQSFLRVLGEDKPKTKGSIGLKGFEEQKLCDMDLNEQISQGLQAVLETADTPAKILKASQDLVREVVAHEVGHTLGLRHNFAGSLAANYELEKREELFKNYLNTGSTPDDLVLSSSVMDYQIPMEAMQAGDQIAKSAKAADYDTKAIQSLYFGKQFEASEWPLFCTDSHVASFLDCQRYDAGNSYVEWTSYEGKYLLKSLPKDFLSFFIEAKAPSLGRKPVDVSKVQLNPTSRAQSILDNQKNFLSLFNNGRLLSVERKFPYVGPANAEQVRAKVVETVSADIKKFGGLEKIFLTTDLNTADGLQEKFEAYLQNPNILRGTGSNGKAYEFTEQDVVSMKSNAKVFFDRLKKDLVAAEVNLLADPRIRLDASVLSTEFIGYLFQRTKHYLLSTTGKPKIYILNSGWTDPQNGNKPASDLSKTKVTLQSFAYPTDVRMKAATFLNILRMEKLDAIVPAKLAAQNLYQKMLMQSLGGISVTSATLPTYPKDVVAWILDATTIFKAMQ